MELSESEVSEPEAVAPEPCGRPPSRPDRASGPGAGYWLYAAHLATVWGIALSNAFLGLTLLFVAMRPRRRARPVLWTGATGSARVLAPLGLYIVFLVVSTATSYDFASSASQVNEIFTLAGLPLALWLVADRKSVRRLVDLLIVVTALAAIYGIAQYVWTDYGTINRRIIGPFPHYMTFSGILLLGDALLLGRMTRGSVRRRVLPWIGLGAINVALVLTLTRSAWLGALAAVLLLLVVTRRWLVPGLVALGAAVLLTVLLVPQGAHRLRSIFDPADRSNYDRLCMLEAGWHMVVERPLYGIGPAQVQHRYPIYRHPTAPRFNVAHLHNSFMQLAAERGLLSLVAYLLLMVGGAVVAWRLYWRGGGLEGSDGDLLLGVLMGLAAFNVAGLFEANWSDSELQQWVLFLLAIPFCVARSAPWATRRLGGDDG